MEEVNSKMKIAVVSGSRAEYGLLRGLIRILHMDAEVDLRLVVSGTHLDPAFGHTVDEIRADGFPIAAEIPCIVSQDDEQGMAFSCARAMEGFAAYFAKERPDLLVLLGDRYEIFACAAAAAMFRIPIAHLYGGDTTEGAVDECFRHAITKMSWLHFVSNEQSRHRVIQLGEDPARVFNYGAPGAENILTLPLMEKAELEASLGVELRGPFALATYHPVTLQEADEAEELRQLFAAIDAFPQMRFLFTKANADSRGQRINAVLEAEAARRTNCFVFDSLGIVRYLSAMRLCALVLGNSSSGIYEAPLFGVPTVNVGPRQKGRLRASTVIDCEAESQAIEAAMRQALAAGRAEKIESPYYKPDTAARIAGEIKKALRSGTICLMKRFYDLPETALGSDLGRKEA